MKNQEKKMTIREIVLAVFDGDQAKADAVLKSGEINFGYNPNWRYPNMLSFSYKVKDSYECKCVGRCISETTFLAYDGCDRIRVSYKCDSSD